MSAEKPKPMKKVPKWKSSIVEHKPIVAAGLIAVVAIAGIVSSIYFLGEEEKKKGGTLNADLGGFLNSFDPLYNPDDWSFWSNRIVWDQIIEGLFTYDLSDEKRSIKPNLAKDYEWSEDGLNLTCQLRKRITFHDGTSFNAAVVKWNFDRIYRIIDIMDWDDIWAWYYMYLQSDGKPIINDTKVIDEYTVRFVLNNPYVPLISLLATMTSYILSPSSTPENDFVDRFTGKLIGTGPFKLESYVMDPIYGLSGNVTVIANRDYWDGKPLIREVNFLYYDYDDAIEKMLSGELSYTLGYDNITLLDMYRNATATTVVEQTRPVVFYLAMNNDIFPLEMRKAISYAFNYSEYLKLWTDNLAIRCKSPLPKGMLYYNWDFKVAEYNVKIARQTLIDANWQGTEDLTADSDISPGNDWERLVDEGTPLETYNYSLIPEFNSHMFHAYLISKYAKQIGVKIELNNLTPQEYWDKMRKGGLDFYIVGWGAAFNDPVEILNPLYSIYGDYNRINFYDPQVQEWLEQGLIETNEKARKHIYYNIQQRLVEELYPVVYLYCENWWHIWASNVKGVPAFSPIFKDAYLR